MIALAYLLVSGLNIALFAWTFARARRDNRRAAIMRRILDFPMEGRR